MKRKNYYYMMVTKDRYQLPIIVTESLREMGRKVGIRPNSIYNAIWRAETEHWKYPTYIRVEKED